PSAAAFLQAVRQPQRGRPTRLGPTSTSDVVPVPLSANIWADAIFHKRIGKDELVGAIIADRQAALVCHGLTRLDDETLAFFGSHQGLLSRVYERSAPVFAAFASGIRVRDNRVAPPGDADAVALWEAVIGEKVTRADRFIQSLLEQGEGRLAFLYDTIAELDAPHRAFVLGSWLPQAMRQDRFKTLATTGLGGIREWQVKVMPFARASYDLAMTFARVAVNADGTPAAPAARGFWTRAFNGPEVADDARIDAAWLAETVVATDVRQRGERLDQVTFGQRGFGAVTDAERAEAVFVLRSMPRFRALLLSFERAGIRRPATYANAVRHAVRLAGLEGRRGFVAQAQLQGSLVLATRMAMVGTIDAPTAERLIEKLTAAQPDAGYAGTVAPWLRQDGHPPLPPWRDIEGAVVAGLAGRTPGAAAPRVTWEGQQYRLDLPASEQIRLRRIREKQRAPAIDMPLQMAEAARLCTLETATVDDLQDAAPQISALAAA